MSAFAFSKLFDTTSGPVMVIVSMECGVGLLCLLVHLWCDVLLVGDLLEDLLEDQLLCLLLLGLFVSYLWLFVYLDLPCNEKMMTSVCCIYLYYNLLCIAWLLQLSYIIYHAGAYLLVVQCCLYVVCSEVRMIRRWSGV